MGSDPVSVIVCYTIGYLLGGVIGHHVYYWQQRRKWRRGASIRKRRRWLFDRPTPTNSKRDASPPKSLATPAWDNVDPTPARLEPPTTTQRFRALRMQHPSR